MTHLTSASLAVLLLLAACRPATSEQADTPDNIEKEARQERNVIRKRILSAGEFTHITNLGSVDIVYTQGDYHIEAEGDSALLNYLLADFDSGVLTVCMQTDNYSDLHFHGNAKHVTLYVSCPRLLCVSVCSNGSFESRGTWKAESIQLGMLDEGTLRIDSAECKNVQLQTTGTGTVSVGHIRTDDATLYARSASTIDMNIEAEELMVINDGGGAISLSGTAKHFSVKNPSDPRLKLNLRP